MRISRIYVDRFGSPTSWYEEMTFDLCDPATGEPIDSCMNLENAGGKTSLLSYIFSCFEPKQERWLQHLQSKSHSFRDYFSRDVRPSFIAIEWVMPPRSANGQSYRVVIGQAVQVKEAADRASEVDRRFFAFESSSGLAWEDLPVPGLSLAPVQSMQAFLNWALQKARLESQGDFYITHNQGEWVSHLEQRRLIDVELLSMQLSFNSREGGSEEGFLSFSSESDLVTKLLNLSMNQEHTSALRDMVVQTMDRLKAKPKYEARLYELQRLQQAMTPFGESAAAFLGAKAALLAVEQDAADIVFTMRDQISALDVRLTKANNAVDQLEQLASKADDDAVVAKRNHFSLQRLKLFREDQAAKQRTDELHQTFKDGLVRLDCLTGALVKRDIFNVEKVIAELESQTAALKEELRPFENEASQNGAMLRFLIQQHINRHQQTRSSLLMQETGLKAGLLRIAQQRNQCSTRVAELSGMKGKIEERIRAANQILDGLIENDWLLPTDIDVSSAITRLRTVITELESMLDELRDQRLVKKASLDDAQAQSSLAQQDITHAQHALATLKQRLNEYDGNVENLHNDPILILLVEGQCDPHSSALVTHVQQFIESTRSEISNCAIRLKQLREQQESIEQTGLAGRSDDVARVVRALNSAGIRSARAANTYVADLRIDAEEARALVLSDPARFLGVNVAKEEWNKAIQVGQSLQLPLSLPVTLAVASLDAESASEDRYVFGPEKDSLFNKAAAAQLLVDCQVLIEQTHVEHDVFSAREKQAQAALAALQRFQHDYTHEAIHQIELEVEQRQEEIEAATAKRATLLELAERLTLELEALNARIEVLPAQIQAHENGLKRLSEYVATWEPQVEAGRRELLEINREMSQTTALLDELREDEGVHSLSLEEVRRDLVDVGATVSDLQREFAQVMRYDADFDAEGCLQETGYDLSVIRTLYSNAMRMLTAEENHKLGIVSYQLGDQRERSIQLAALFLKEYGRLDDLFITELARSDIDIGAEIDSQKKLNTRLDSEKERAVHDAAVTGSMLNSFLREHSPEEPSEDMHRLDDEEVSNALERELAAAVARGAEAETLRRQITQQRIDSAADEKRKDGLVVQVNFVASAFPATTAEPKLIPLDGDIQRRVTALVETRTARDAAVKNCSLETSRAHRDLVRVATHSDFIAVEPEVSMHISQDDFDKACTDHDRLAEMIHDRVASVTDQLNEMIPDFESCVNEVYNQATSASSLVKYASGITMPAGTPYVGGKEILKMSANLSAKSSEQRKLEIRHYLNSQIEDGVVPSSGADIITQCLLRFTNEKSFGLHMLKMEQNIDFQYQPVNAMKKSGGQGTVIATFLYMLVSHMRVSTQTQAKRGGGGPLLLDNPFANVQTRALIEAQRKLATSLGIQLICFTANADANILEGFRRIIRLRKAGVNSKTKRTHIEMARATFAEAAV